jgi:hypothetical protein
MPGAMMCSAVSIRSDFDEAPLRTVGTSYPAQRDRIFFSLAGLVVFAAILSAQTPQEIELSTAHPRLEIHKTNVFSTSVVVRNTSQEKRRYTATLILPPQWRSLTVEPVFELSPQQSDIRLLSVALPQATRAGSYVVRYGVEDNARPPHRAEVTIEVLVAPVLRLEFQLLDAPRFVVGGKTYTATFTLTNQGNTSVEVAIEGHNSHFFRFRMDSTTLTLLPQTTRTVSVTVQTPEDLSEKVTNTMEVTARMLQQGAGGQRASATVDVIPHVKRVQNLYHELPLSARLRSTGDEAGNRQQVELFGSGSLTESRRDQLEFLVRSPETQTASALGLRDEYRLRYRNPDLEVQLGDWNYTLSPLTELSRYAAGASARLYFNNFQAGGFYNQNRYSGPRQQELAGFLRYQFPGEHAVGVNYLKKREVSESDIVTFRGNVQLWKESEVEAEYGVSKARNGRAQAYALHANGRATWFSYDLRYVNADPKYTGYYQDLNLKSLSVNLFPWQHLRLEGYVRDEKRNVERDTLHFFAPRDQYQQVGLGYSSYFSLYYRSSKQEDLFPISKYRRQQQTAQLHLGYSFSGASVYLDVDRGVTQDLLVGKRFPFHRYALFTSLNPSSAQTYTVSIEHAEENNLYSDEKLERSSAGLTAWLMVGGATQFQLNVFGSRLLSSVDQTYGFVDMTLDHLFSFGHRIVVKGRQSFSRPVFHARERAFAVEYSVPIGVPLHRIASLGQLRGRIMDDRGVGVRNVLVNAGAFVAVTDVDGQYLFPSLPPGTYFVVVDPASIGIGYITLRPMPVEVIVRGAAEERLDIGVVKSARVGGTVRSFDFAEEGITDTTQTRLADAGGRQGIILELSNGVEIHRRITDTQGRFLFADLRPGRWTLRVAGGDMPAQHYLERESLDLEVQPGSEHQVALRILPRRRTLRIIQEGTVLQAITPAPRAKSSRQATRESSLPCLVSFDSEKKGFVLQISSWETEQKARQVARSVEQLSGYVATVERVDAPQLGIRYRVILGVFKSREEAEATCRTLHLQQSR